MPVNRKDSGSTPTLYKYLLSQFYITLLKRVDPDTNRLKILYMPIDDPKGRMIIVRSLVNILLLPCDN